MIKSLIQIEGEAICDFQDKFGFIYKNADERTGPDEKEDAVTSYAEESGEHRDGRTTSAPFDYTATFIIEAPNMNLKNVNTKIRAFNDAIRVRSEGSDIVRKRKITFYNLLNRVVIVGYPNLIAEPTEVFHSQTRGGIDYAMVELKIRVDKPDECDYSYQYPPLYLQNESGDAFEMETGGGIEMEDSPE